MSQQVVYQENQLSTDSLFEGKVLLKQPQKGYRFSIDAPLLTWFCCLGKPAQRTADLGAGCGVIGISLLLANHTQELTALEIQPQLADLCEQNGRLNNLLGRMVTICGSVTGAQPALIEHSFDLVVTNPPFWPVKSGRLPPDNERRIARHEVCLNLNELIAQTRRLLHPRRGRFCIAFPARRLDDLLYAVKDGGLSARHGILVHPKQKSPAELILLECRPGAGGQLELAPPLFLKHADDNYTDQTTSILRGDFADSLGTICDHRNEPAKQETS